MGSLHDFEFAHSEQEPRSEWRRMENPHHLKIAHRDHEPRPTTFCRMCDKRLYRSSGRFMERGLVSLQRLGGLSPMNRSHRRQVLECARPLALWKSWAAESARGLAHSKTLPRLVVRQRDPVVSGIQARNDSRRILTPAFGFVVSPTDRSVPAVGNIRIKIESKDLP